MEFIRRKWGVGVPIFVVFPKFYDTDIVKFAIINIIITVPGTPPFLLRFPLDRALDGLRCERRE